MASIPWSVEDNLRLTRAYINIYETTRVNDPSYWTRLTYAFNADPQTAPENYRNTVDITAKWYELKIEVLVFNNLYTKIDDAR